MVIFETKLRTRYSETDQMGYVYYGNYASYYEVARVEMFRSVGISYKEMEENGIKMPVLELHNKFLKPARYDELITILVKLEEMPAVRTRFTYEIYNERNELINIGETLLVFIDTVRNKPCRAPDYVINHLRPHFNNRS